MPAPEQSQGQDRSNERRQSAPGPEKQRQLPPNLWPWWLIFVALLAWNLFAWWPSQSDSVTIPYSTFLAQVRADNVLTVHIVSDDISGQFGRPLL